MGKGFKCGGSGFGPDFRVVAYPTEEALICAAPVEKTLGIVTADAITGWTVGNDMPEDAGQGHLWIQTGTSSLGRFNALAHNSLWLCPIAARQRDADGWADRVGKTFLEGTWRSWEPEAVYLFQAGDQNTALTGGWSDIDPAAQKLTRSHSIQTEDGVSIHTTTVNPVDLTDYGLLSVTVEEYKDYFHVILLDGSGNQKASVAAQTAPGVVSMNLASISGSFYIRLYAHGDEHGGYASASFAVSEVKLEKTDAAQEMQQALTVLGVEV